MWPILYCGYSENPRIRYNLYFTSLKGKVPVIIKVMNNFNIYLFKLLHDIYIIIKYRYNRLIIRARYTIYNNM